MIPYSGGAAPADALTTGPTKKNSEDEWVLTILDPQESPEQGATDCADKKNMNTIKVRNWFQKK